ncbi:MAG TPA: aldo/keto reductase [Cyclobacteriaceae bacterium]|nr:aldo/keto reductase [Cyclobacteriaceae bacterium]
MATRRDFMATGLKAVAATGLAPVIPVFSKGAPPGKPFGKASPGRRNFEFEQAFGLGGVAIGNAFRPTTDQQAQEAMEGAWAAGVRYFDTSPWYGLGLSERRFGHFLHNHNREDYILSTKVGRILKASKSPPKTMWQQPSPFDYEYDYSAEGTRRSIEDSLQRLGIESIDIVFIHDLSPDNGDMKDNWTDHFKVAEKGAMPELTRMREEGLIKAWGLGVNTVEPILKTLEAADPDICLSATIYSLIEHEDALNRLFPACEQHGVSIVAGAPLNSGFLAGINRYNYSTNIPEGFLEKREKISRIASAHGVDVRTAALQFAAAPSVVSAVIPGTRYPEQARANVASMKTKIPGDFWEELKQEELIAAHAPTPG